jgi:hypothetical protein
MYEFLATLTLIVHFLFIVFVVFGGLLFFIKAWTLYFHIPAFLYGAYNYLYAIIYPVNLTKDLQINLGISLIVLNAVIYGVVVIKYKKN